MLHLFAKGATTFVEVGITVGCEQTDTRCPLTLTDRKSSKQSMYTQKVLGD
jgi:hypothetical protein